MNVDELCERLSTSLPPYLSARQRHARASEFVRPCSFLTEAVIDVFVLERHGAFTVSDFGDAIGWLGMQPPDDSDLTNSRPLSRTPAKPWVLSLRARSSSCGQYCPPTWPML